MGDFKVGDFCRHLSGDIEMLFTQGKHPSFDSKKEAIVSVALRALGALVMVIAAAALLSGIGLALTGSIGPGVFTVIMVIAVIRASVLGIIAHDLIQMGQKMEPKGRHPLV